MTPKFCRFYTHHEDGAPDSDAISVSQLNGRSDVIESEPGSADRVTM